MKEGKTAMGCRASRRHTPRAEKTRARGGVVAVAVSAAVADSAVEVAVAVVAVPAVTVALAGSERWTEPYFNCNSLQHSALLNSLFCAAFALYGTTFAVGFAVSRCCVPELVSQKLCHWLRQCGKLLLGTGIYQVCKVLI